VAVARLGRTHHYTGEGGVSNNPLAPACIFSGSAEVHRVPQRAAHYTGDSDSVNTFFKFFFDWLKRRPDEAFRGSMGDAKSSLSRGKNRVLSDLTPTGPAQRTDISPGATREFRRSSRQIPAD